MEKLLVKDYDFYLPEEQIAQDPLSKRSDSRLLVLNRETGEILHEHFYNIGNYLKAEDTLVINNTKVIPARLYGKRSTGAAIEVLLLKRLSDNTWEALTRPGKRTLPGTEIEFGDGLLKAVVEDVADEGIRIIRFIYEGIFEEILDKLGEMPLPPYITHKLKDRDRYQTVYAKYDGSAAAPTAGLHFTPELIASLKEKGVHFAEITLHVGLGTFRPVKEENVLDHKMHEEYYEISPKACEIINATRARGGRIIAVGTTSVRTLETVAGKLADAWAGKSDSANNMVSKAPDKPVAAMSGNTDIFIYPGYDFKAVDGIVTNFHLPKSTLLMLISAFAGREQILDTYRKAVENGYRFFSFGDSMLIV